MAEKSFWSDKKDKEWFSNFFFYYGKYIIVAIIFIIIFVCATVSCVQKPEYDLEIYYMSDQHLESVMFDNLENELVKIIDNADGKQGEKVYFHDFTVVPENAVTSDVDLYMASKVHAEIASGHGYLYIMNEQWKDYCVNNEVMEDISAYTGGNGPIYSVEVTDNKLLTNLGIKNDGKLYIGVRMINYDRVGDKVEVKKHKNALKSLQYILKNK